MRQHGFGWGKGRRVIKTRIPGDALPRALERHQRWLDAHVDRRVVDAELGAVLQAHRRAIVDRLNALRRENRHLRAQLRLAKAEGTS